MEALYRKYRPERFAELVGQEHVKKVLMRAIEEGRVSHAYIFAGPRGTGKTTTARILAKALNCDNRRGAEPCGECYSCKAIDEGTFMDVIELDAASNRGIDEIRRIRDAASFRPIEGKYKVYIIDEVHMLTKEAFNALLKTLEEPPEHVVFVLATTNIEKVPPTIISRCQVLEFRNLPDDLVAGRLREICERESIDATDQALRFIAKRAMGGMRDALTMLEQVWKFAGGKIDVPEVESALGLIRSDIVKSYVQSIMEGDVAKLKKVIDEVYYSGKELEVLVQEALDHVLERIEEGEVEFVPLSKELIGVLREIKTFENKKLYLMAASVSMMKKIKISEIPKKEIVKEEVKEEIGKEEGIKEKRKETEEEVVKEVEAEKKAEGVKSPELEEVMKYFRDEGDLSVYVALSMADGVEVGEGEVKITFIKDKAYHLDILKQHLFEVEEMFKKVLGRDVTLKVESVETTEKHEQVKGKIMSLFGDKEG